MKPLTSAAWFVAHSWVAVWIIVCLLMVVIALLVAQVA